MSNLKSKTKALYGIESWLRSQGLKVTTKTVSQITSSFLKSKGLPYKKFNPKYKGMFNAGICNAESVQENFKDFKKYVIDNYVNNKNYFSEVFVVDFPSKGDITPIDIVCDVTRLSYQEIKEIFTTFKV